MTTETKSKEMTKLERTSAETKTRSILLDTEILNVPNMKIMQDLFVLQTIPSTTSEDSQLLRKVASDRLMAQIVGNSNYKNLFGLLKLLFTRNGPSL